MGRNRAGTLFTSYPCLWAHDLLPDMPVNKSKVFLEVLPRLVQCVGDLEGDEIFLATEERATMCADCQPRSLCSLSAASHQPPVWHWGRGRTQDDSVIC